MAKKITLDFYSEPICTSNLMPRGEAQGYEVGALGVFQSTVSKRWRVVHIESMSPTMGSLEGFKTKKEAIEFATELQAHGLDFNVSGQEEFLKKNYIEKAGQVFQLAIEKVKGE